MTSSVPLAPKLSGAGHGSPQVFECSRSLFPILPIPTRAGKVRQPLRQSILTSRTITAVSRVADMRYRSLGNSGTCRLRALPRHDDLRQRDRRGGRARAARPVRRGRRHPGRHGRRLHRRGLRGDHRSLARRPARDVTRPGGARHQGPVPVRARAERRRLVRAPPHPRPRRLAGSGSASTRSTSTRCTPGTRGHRWRRRCGPSTASCARPHPLLRLLQLHRLAADQGGPPRPRARVWPRR